MYVYVVWKDIICNYVIMCMNDIIVIDDSNVEYKDRHRAGQAKMYQPPVLYVCTAPFSQCFSLTSVRSVVSSVARQVLCWMDI